MARYREEAREMLARRQLRQDHFNPLAFGEPAWDLMLHLYVLRSVLDPQPLPRLMQRLRMTQEIVCRWLAYLEDEGLVMQIPAGDNDALAYLKLTVLGEQRLDAYFRAVTELKD